MEEDTKRINEEHITSSYSWIGGGMRINISTCQQPPTNEEAGLQKKDLLCLRAMKTKTARGRMLWFPLYCQISVRTKTTRTFASSFSDISARPAIPFNSQYSSSSFATSLQWSAGIGTFTWIYWKCVGGGCYVGYLLYSQKELYVYKFYILILEFKRGVELEELACHMFC